MLMPCGKTISDRVGFNEWPSLCKATMRPVFLMCAGICCSSATDKSKLLICIISCFWQVLLYYKTVLQKCSYYSAYYTAYLYTWLHFAYTSLLSTSRSAQHSISNWEGPPRRTLLSLSHLTFDPLTSNYRHSFFNVGKQQKCRAEECADKSSPWAA